MYYSASVVGRKSVSVAHTVSCSLQVMSNADALLKCASALSRLDVALSLGLLAQERVRSGNDGEGWK